MRDILFDEKIDNEPIGAGHDSALEFAEVSTNRELFDIDSINVSESVDKGIVQKFKRILGLGNEMYRRITHKMDLMRYAVGCDIWVINFDPQGNITSVDWGNGVRELLGYDKESYPNTLDSWINVLHPDERDSVLKDFYTVSSLKNAPELTKTEFRMKRSDGVYHWFKAYGKQVYRADGSLESYMGVYKDVNAEHETKERLLMAETISGIFSFCIYIDMKTGGYQELITSDMVRVADPYLNREAFHDIWKIFEIGISDEYQQMGMEFMNPDTLQKRLLEKAYLYPDSKPVITLEVYSHLARCWYRLCFIGGDQETDGRFRHIMFGVSDITEDKVRVEKLIYTSRTDELTGVFNRRAYEEDVETYKISPIEENLIYLSFDVNGLKKINDTIGHAAGDELIQGAAFCLCRCFERFGRIYRMGGDEFAAIIFVDQNKLSDIIEQFDNTINNWHGKQVGQMAISCGYAFASEFPDVSMSELSKVADQRMYEAKAAYYRENGIDRRRR